MCEPNGTAGCSSDPNDDEEKLRSPELAVLASKTPCKGMSAWSGRAYGADSLNSNIYFLLVWFSPTSGENGSTHSYLIFLSHVVVQFNKIQLKLVQRYLLLIGTSCYCGYNKQGISSWSIL